MKKQPDDFLRQATKMGLEQMLNDLDALLQTDLSTAQRIATEEMRKQVAKYLEDV